MRISTTSLSSCLIGIAIITTPSALAKPPQTPWPDQSDWIPLPETCSLCAGQYQELIPPQEKDHLSHTRNKAPLKIEALQGQFSEYETNLQGSVVAIQNDFMLKADAMRLIQIQNPQHKNKQIQSVFAKGRVDFTQPGFRLMADQAEWRPLEKTHDFKNGFYRLYSKQAHGEASQFHSGFSSKNEEKATLRQATYSTCSPQKRTWYLKAKKLILNKNTGRGQAQHARLYWLNWPVFYWPYLDFPINNQRYSGFLFPSFTSSKEHGLSWNIPFYWNIAPHYDATVAWHNYSKRGAAFDFTSRYLQQHGQGKIHWDYLPNDREHKRYVQNKLLHPGQITPQDPRYLSLKGKNRYLFGAVGSHSFNHTGQPLHLRFDYHKASDSNYFQNFDSNWLPSNANHLLQRAIFSTSFGPWETQLNVQRYQTLHPFEEAITKPVYRMEPQISAVAHFGESWTLSIPLEGTNFTHLKHLGTDFRETTGQRFNLRPMLAWEGGETASWFIKPRIHFDVTRYHLHLSTSQSAAGKPTDPRRTLPIVELDSGLIFDRTALKTKDGITHTQTLEPRVYALWVPYRNQNNLPIFDTTLQEFDYNLLYRNNRFTGLDRMGDAQQVTCGLSSRLIEQGSGFEQAQVEIGQIFYLKPRRLGLCDGQHPANCHFTTRGLEKFSNFIGGASFNVQDHFSSRAQLEYNWKTQGLDKSGIYVHYHPHSTPLLRSYFGYEYLRQDPSFQRQALVNRSKPLKQLDSAISLPLNLRWRILARFQYNLQGRYPQNTLWAIEQQGCCTAIRLGANRSMNTVENNNFLKKPPLKTRTTFFLQIIFKGLASIGQSDLDHYLQTALPGYEFYKS